jgi:hypothetical protein
MSEFNRGGFGDDLFGSPYVLGLPARVRGMGTARVGTSRLLSGAGTARGRSHSQTDTLRTRFAAPGVAAARSNTASGVIRRRYFPTVSTRSISTAKAGTRRRRGYLVASVRGISRAKLSPLRRMTSVCIAHGTSRATGTLFKLVLPPPVSGMRIASWARRTPAADLRFQGWTARV